MKNLADITLKVTPPPNISIGTPSTPGTTLANFISVIVGAMTMIAAIWFLIKIISGGITIINSNGDKQAVAAARSSITNGLIGLIVVISATFIIGLLGYIFRAEGFLDVAGFLGV